MEKVQRHFWKQLVSFYIESDVNILSGYRPRNGEEMAISRVGKELYEMLIKPYTKKQWDKYPKELDAEVFTRLPYREDRDDRLI